MESSEGSGVGIEIDSPIVGYEVVSRTDGEPVSGSNVAQIEDLPTSNVIQMNERLERPDALRGTTYKVKAPVMEHALYITINDIVLNEGTEHESRRPFEIFINSKNMDNFQWVVALTRVMSSVFRKGGDVAFLVEELHSVFDPNGGYFKAGGKRMPSIVAEIGDVVERHLTYLGLLKSNIDERQRKYLEKKRKEYESEESSGGFPTSASLCSKCHQKSVIMVDGCATCLNCADSQCG